MIPVFNKRMYIKILFNCCELNGYLLKTEVHCLSPEIGSLTSTSLKPGKE